MFSEGSNIKNVCQTCVAPIRHPGCHSTCESYKAWREEYDKQKDHIKQATQSFNRDRYYKTDEGHWRKMRP